MGVQYESVFVVSLLLEQNSKSHCFFKQNNKKAAKNI